MLENIREPVNTYTHFFGIILALVGWLILQIAVGDTDFWLAVVVAINGVTNVLTFFASTSLHAYNGSKRVLLWLVRFDHASIYLMIAGTYTPMAYLLLPDNTQRAGLLIAVWLMALVGVLYKLTRWQQDTILSTVYYVLMGWLVLPYIPIAFPQTPFIAIVLLFIGGFAYTVGAVIFTMRRPNLTPRWGFHELWHICVLVGFSFHWGALALIVFASLP